MKISSNIKRLLNEYDKENITIATVCSHSALQCFYGAKLEGFKTMGIISKKELDRKPNLIETYRAFKLSKPDEFNIINDYSELLEEEKIEELISKNVIIIPNGSFVEYMGAENFKKMNIPTFGNRRVLEWESDREKQRKWLTSAGISMPNKFDSPEEINKPVIVKYYGAKGGRGFFIAHNKEEFERKIDPKKLDSGEFIIQEYVPGVRYYPEFFYSPISGTEKWGYPVKKGGRIELLTIDRRDEADVDEIYKLGSPADLEAMGITPTWVVTGNVPCVLRESLLPKVFDYSEKAVSSSIDLFGGMIGPFCLEGVVTRDLEFIVFEISARIVAGSNPGVSGSPYSDLLKPGISTGQRIAHEIAKAIDIGKLEEVVS